MNPEAFSRVLDHYYYSFADGGGALEVDLDWWATPGWWYSDDCWCCPTMCCCCIDSHACCALRSISRIGSRIRASANSNRDRAVESTAHWGSPIARFSYTERKSKDRLRIELFRCRSRAHDRWNNGRKELWRSTSKTPNRWSSPPNKSNYYRKSISLVIDAVVGTPRNDIDYIVDMLLSFVH